MHSKVRCRAAALAAPLLAAILALEPVPRAHATPPPLQTTAAAACAGGWQLRTSLKECALRVAGAALVGAVLPLPFAVPLSMALAAGAVFTCF